MELITKKAQVLVAGLAMAVLSSVSHGAVVLYNGVNLIEDDNIDRMSFDANQDGRLDVGDRLEAILDFNLITTVPVGSSNAPSELTGYTEIEVISKVPLPGGQFLINYGPSAAFTATYGAGAMVALFDDPANNLNLTATCTSVAGCFAAATDGALWAVLGIGDADDQWFSLGSDNISVAHGLGAATKVATINFALSFLTNNTGRTFLDQAVPCIIGFACPGDGMTQVIGSADILGGSGLDDGHVRSDIDATVRVPEPATLGLLGLSILGMGIGSKLRARKAV